jgi:carnitine-CoA ligase
MTSEQSAQPTDQTLPALLDRQGARWSDKTLVRAGAAAWSFAELRDLAAERAGALVAAGIGVGDRVAVMSENRIEVLELWLGCAWIGAVLVPVNTAFRGEQLQHVLSSAAPKALVLEHALADRLELIRRPPSLERTWTLDEAGGLPPRAGAVPPHPCGPGDPAAILYTSGTTGPSKGVVCPHGQWYWWGVLTGRVLGIEDGSVLYTGLPLFHTNALNAFCQALVAGATYVLGSRFSASTFWSRLEGAGATVTYLLGPMVSILLRQPPSSADRAHRVRVALAPGTPADLHEPFLERFGVRLIDGWGSTETNIVIANSLEDVRPGTIGRVLDEFEAKVVGADGAEVAAGTAGELLVRPRHRHSFSSGYFGLPEQTAQAWRDSWFHTGDRVVRDGDGWFRFVDRLKDVIRRRGENISSHEVEHVLLAHPDVSSAAVIPVPSELGEDEVMAYVVLREGATIDPAELVRFCEPRIAYFAIPRYIDLVSELPQTASGKVEKFRLRERGVTESTWDREEAASDAG